MAIPNIRKKKITVYSVFAGILLLLFLLQYLGIRTAPAGKPSVLILVPAVAVAGILFKDWAGAFYGLAVGVAMDIVTADAVCFNAIVLMVVGWLSGFLISRFMINNWISALLILIGQTFLYGTLKWLVFIVIRQGREIGLYFVRITLPTALYSIVFGIPLYFVMRTIARRLVK